VVRSVRVCDISGYGSYWTKWTSSVENSIHYTV
jgi:hypothetical protein